MAHTKRTTCKYNDDAGPSGWVQKKQNKGKESKARGYLSIKKKGESEQKKAEDLEKKNSKRNYLKDVSHPTFCSRFNNSLIRSS